MSINKNLYSLTKLSFILKLKADFTCIRKCYLNYEYSVPNKKIKSLQNMYNSFLIKIIVN